MFEKRGGPRGGGGGGDEEEENFASRRFAFGRHCLGQDDQLSLLARQDLRRLRQLLDGVRHVVRIDPVRLRRRGLFGAVRQMFQQTIQRQKKRRLSESGRRRGQRVSRDFPKRLLLVLVVAAVSQGRRKFAGEKTTI